MIGDASMSQLQNLGSDGEKKRWHVGRLWVMPWTICNNPWDAVESSNP